MLVALSIVLSVVAVPAGADVDQGDIRAAEAMAGEAGARLRAAEADLAAGRRRLDRLEESLASVAAGLERQDDEIVAGRAEARDRIARMYMSAGGAETSGVLGAGNITDLPAHVAYLGALADQDREFVNGLAVTRADLERLQGTIEATMAEQVEVVAGLEGLVAQRRSELEAAQAQVSAVAAEWQRQEDERRAREQAELLRQQAEAQAQAQAQAEAEAQARAEEEARSQA
ncbi:MAG: hypothetical protein KJ698_03645, partial [Actinobacteria bacterium]|nr:hypothetical protein [Actinomycetota bacterium]